MKRISIRTKAKGFRAVNWPLFFIFLLVWPLGLHAQDLGFKDFDKDADGYVEKTEFMDLFTAMYISDWDNYDNRGLDDEDFYTYTYSVIDMNDDNKLAVDEWDYGYRNYWGDVVLNDLNKYDTNSDHYISSDEYVNALKKTSVFVTWDVDKDTYLSRNELAANVFAKWDTDDDMKMDRTEFVKFDAAYGGI